MAIGKGVVLVMADQISCGMILLDYLQSFPGYVCPTVYGNHIGITLVDGLNEVAVDCSDYWTDNKLVLKFAAERFYLGN